MGKQARVSVLSSVKTYECQQDWPEDCFVQCGDRGIVLTSDPIEVVLAQPEKAIQTVGAALDILPDQGQIPHYRTAFFEAFPRQPKTFIRGEGATIAEAEQSAWDQFQRYLACPGPHGHEFEARGYENGGGFCVHCGMFGSGVIPPVYPCAVCGKLTWYTKDAKGNFYCETHAELILEENLTEVQRVLRRMKQELNDNPQGG